MDRPIFRLRKDARASTAFWWGLPVVILCLVSRVPVPGVDFPLDGVFNLLPIPVADLLYWYPATFFSVCVLGAFVWHRVRHRTASAHPPIWLPTFFLPTYIAGLESPGLMRWCMRCGPGVVTNPAEKFTWGVVVNAEALAIAVVAGALAAMLCGHRSRLWLPIPAVVPAIVGQIALPWCLFLYIAHGFPW